MVRKHIGMLASLMMVAAGLVWTAPQALAAPVQPAATVQYDYGLIRKGTKLYARAATTDPWVLIATKVRKVFRGQGEGVIVVVTTSGEVRIKRRFDDTWHSVATHATDAVASTCIIVVRKGSTIYASRGIAYPLTKVAKSATTPVVSGCLMAYRTKGKAVWASGSNLVFNRVATNTSGFALSGDYMSTAFSTLLVIRKGSKLYATRNLALAPTFFGTSDRTPVVASGHSVVFRNSKREVWARWEDDPWTKVGVKMDGFATDSLRVLMRRGSALYYNNIPPMDAPFLLTATASRTPFPFYLHLQYVSKQKKLYTSSDWATWQLSATGVDWFSFDSI